MTPTFMSGEDIQYANVKKKFKDHFKGKVALVFQRTQFIGCFQQDKQSVLTFIEDLQKRADLCSSGDLRDQMVHTKIIAGLHDSHLRRQMMPNDNLTLDQVIKEVKLNPPKSPNINIKFYKTTEVPSTHRKHMTGKFQKTNVEVQNPNILEVLRKRNKKSCYRCGAQPGHPPQRCPAKDATCNACNKKGHYSKVCKSSKRVHRVGEDSDEDDISVMTVNEVVNAIETSEKWRTNLLIGNSEINFKIDTGADVTVIPEEVFRQCNLGKLHPTSKRLFGAGHNGLRIIGTVRNTLSLGETYVTEDIYVVKGLKEPLLGQPAIEKINLVARINEIQSQSYEERIKVKYPQLFHGLGEREGEWENVRESVKSS